jgi:hypothetical protein
LFCHRLLPSRKHGSAVDDAVVPPVRAHWQSQLQVDRRPHDRSVERYGRAAGFQPNEWMAMNHHAHRANPISPAELCRARMRNHSLQRWGWASMCVLLHVFPGAERAREGGMGSVQAARSVTRGGGCEGSDDPAPGSTHSHVAPLSDLRHIGRVAAPAASPRTFFLDSGTWCSTLRTFHFLAWNNLKL